MDPLRFSASGCRIIADSVLLEEENFPDFQAGKYYPANIDVFASTYQIVGKLGFGTTSTVWLARNLLNCGYVVLKVYTRGSDHRHEFDTLDGISKANPSHRGYPYVCSALDIFELHHPAGTHFCLVQQPMWQRFRDLLRRGERKRFTVPMLKASLKCLFLALDYIHSECKLVHTDIKGDNILLSIRDESILDAFVKAELATPSPREVVGDYTIYASRPFFGMPKEFGVGLPVLSDFGEAVRGDVRHNCDAQPSV